MKGSYLRHIATSTGCRVTLHGRGSGALDGPLRQENPEPLHINIVADTSAALESARNLAYSLVGSIRHEAAQQRYGQSSTTTPTDALISGPESARAHDQRAVPRSSPYSANNASPVYSLEQSSVEGDNNWAYRPKETSSGGSVTSSESSVKSLRDRRLDPRPDVTSSQQSNEADHEEAPKKRGRSFREKRTFVEKQDRVVAVPEEPASRYEQTTTTANKSFAFSPLAPVETPSVSVKPEKLMPPPPPRKQSAASLMPPPPPKRKTAASKTSMPPPKSKQQRLTPTLSSQVQKNTPPSFESNNCSLVDYDSD